MKILVTGVAGQLGHDVMNELNSRGHDGTGSDIAERYAGIADGSPVTGMPYVQMDITDPGSVEKTIRAVAPDAVIHCAAWTAVDLAEDADKTDRVRAINGTGTGYIAGVCRDLGCKMMYISTDYVFNGLGDTPWEPDCRDYQPLNVYGQTKLEGEQAVASALEKYFIVRIAWVFGKNGKNFIRTMLSLGKSHDTIHVVSDQIGTPTYTRDLARLLADMIETENYGYYHATNAELPDTADGYTSDGCKTGYISWYDFTKEIFRQAAALGHSEYTPEQTRLIPVTTAEYGASKARRPYNSRLDKRKLAENGFAPLPDWQDALRRYLREIEF